jgi:hypothetical protein
MSGSVASAIRNSLNASTSTAYRKTETSITGNWRAELSLHPFFWRFGRPELEGVELTAL